MGSVNSCPVVSQAKSVAFILAEQYDEALEVQVIFVHEFPVLSQVMSIFYLYIGRFDLARKALFCSLVRALCFSQTVPLFGHVIGIIHPVENPTEIFLVSYLSAQRATLLMTVGIFGSEYHPLLGAFSAIVAGFCFDTAVFRILPRQYERWENPVPTIVDVFFNVPFADGLTGLLAPFMIYRRVFLVPIFSLNYCGRFGSFW